MKHQSEVGLSWPGLCGHQFKCHCKILYHRGQACSVDFDG
jgi:hypothetical protein